QPRVLRAKFQPQRVLEEVLRFFDIAGRIPDHAFERQPLSPVQVWPAFHLLDRCRQHAALRGVTQLTLEGSLTAPRDAVRLPPQMRYTSHMLGVGRGPRR